MRQRTIRGGLGESIAFIAGRSFVHDIDRSGGISADAKFELDIDDRSCTCTSRKITKCDLVMIPGIVRIRVHIGR